MKKVLVGFKNFIFCMLFFAILFQILIQGAELFRFKNPESSSAALTGFYAEDNDTIDVVCIGSSATYRFYSAPVMYKEHKITMYNYATAQMPFEAVAELLGEIENTQNPKLFVIELRNFVKRTNSIDNGHKETEAYLQEKESYINRLINNMPITFERAKLIHDIIPDLLYQNELNWQFEYARTHNNWKDLKFEDIKYYISDKLHEEQVRENNKNSYKGATTVNAVDYNPPVDVSSFDDVATLSQDRLEILDTLVAKIKEKGYNVLFISSPYPVKENLYAYEKSLEKYFKENGMDYLNCNDHYDEIGIDFASDFYDKAHSNTLGAAKITKYLGSYIKENYGIKATSLNKAQQKEWQKAVDAWYSEVYEPGVEKIMKTVNKHKAKGSTKY